MPTPDFSSASDGVNADLDGPYPPMASVANIGRSRPAPYLAMVEHDDPGWAHSVRGTVRDHPLSAVATAAVLGMLIGRLTR